MALSKATRMIQIGVASTCVLSLGSFANENITAVEPRNTHDDFLALGYALAFRGQGYSSARPSSYAATTATGEPANPITNEATGLDPGYTPAPPDWAPPEGSLPLPKSGTNNVGQDPELPNTNRVESVPQPVSTSTTPVMVEQQQSTTLEPLPDTTINESAPSQSVYLGNDTVRPFAGDTELTALSGGQVPFARGLGLGNKWYQLGFTLTGVFDDNIKLNGNGHSKDSGLLTFIAGSVAAHLGEPDANFYISTAYTAGATLVSTGSSQDSFDQSAQLDLSWKLPKLTLGLHLRFEDVAGADSDVGDRVRRNIFYAGVTASYPIAAKLSLDFDADVTYADYHSLIGSTETRFQTFINYAAFPKITFGLGAQLGWLDVNHASDQRYEQALFRTNYEATEKLSLNASAGVEFRNFGGGAGDSTTPVFSLGAVYKLFERTTITADARRRIYSSAALQDQDYTATGFTLGIDQKISPKLSSSLAGGYEDTEYNAVAKGVLATRHDGYFFVRVGANLAIRDGINLGAFYERSDNSSSGAGSRSFSRDRVGVQVSVLF